MRRWLLLGAALLVIGAAAIVYALGRLNDYLATHREELAALASQALGRPVTFERIGVSLRGGGSARVTDLRVADDPRLGGDFLRAASAVVSVSLLDAARGRLRVRAVVLDAPSLTLIRDASGWNVDSLKPLNSAAEPAAPAAAPAAPPAATSAPAAPPPFHIDSVRLHDGTLTVDDRLQHPPTALTIDQVDLALSQSDPRSPLRIRGAAALFGAAAHNASIAGTLTPGTPATADLHARWDPVPLADLRALVPTLRTLAVGGQIGGDLHFAGPLRAPNDRPAAWLTAVSGRLELQQLTLQLPAIALPISDLSGALQLGPEAIELTDTTARLGDSPVALRCHLSPPAGGAAQCRLTAATIDLRALHGGDGVLREVTIDASVPPLDADPRTSATVQIASGEVGAAAFRQLRAAGSLQGGAITVERSSLEAFGGTAETSGHCANATGPSPECRGTLALHGIEIARALAGLRPDGAQQIDGRLDVDLQLSAGGRERAALQRSVRGSGSLRVDDGVVGGVNLAQRVLGAIPGVGSAARPGSRAAKLLGDGATRFKRLTATLRIGDQRVASDDVAMVADDFTVDAAGSIGFGGALAARGTFHGAAPLIDELSQGVPLLGTLVASTKGIVTIPFRVHGTLRDPRVEPDLTAVAGGIGREASAGLKALFGAPDAEHGKPGGVVRQGLDRLLGE